MSILGNMFSRILGRGQPPTGSAQKAQAARPAAASPASVSAPPAAAAGSAAAVPRMDDVDLGSLLDGLAGQQAQKLNWRQSIVDLMKLLGMSSSLAERRELAKELGYSGDTKDTAQMNIWLHQQVLRKIADNGGKVPQDLLH
jgi:3-oxoacyl-ACP reductase-like protein